MFFKVQFRKYFVLFCAVLVLTPVYNSFASQKPRNYDAIISTTNHKYKGFLLDVNEKGLTIDYLGRSKFISADSISKIKIKRSSALRRHALVGSAIGLLAGIPIYVDGNSKGKLSSLALPVVLIGTTLTGALMGSLINTVTATKRFNGINSGSSFKSIQPVLLRYSKASPTRVPAEAE